MTIAELKAKIEALEKEKKELEKAITLFQTEGRAWEVRASLDLIKKTVEKYLLQLMQEIPNVDINVRGFSLKWKKTQSSTKTQSIVTIVKNQVSTKIEREKKESAKESFIAKVARLSRLHPDIHVTHSALSYQKTAKAWLTKNFPEELAIS